MFDKVTITEVMQLLLNIRVGYPVFANSLNIDEMLDALANTGESDKIEPYMYERLLWVFVRFTQLLYNFPPITQQQLMEYEKQTEGPGIN